LRSSISDNERPSPLDVYSLFFISFYIQIYHADIETAETYSALFPYREPHVSPVKILSDASAYCCCFLSTAVRSILHWLCAAYVGQCSAAGSGGTRRLKKSLVVVTWQSFPGARVGCCNIERRRSSLHGSAGCL